MQSVEVTCPYCFETIELWLEDDLEGEMVQDCDVCCRPWRVVIQRVGADLQCWVDRLQ